MPLLPIDDNRSQIERWRDSGELPDIIDALKPTEVEPFHFLWEVWSRVNQQIPDGMGDTYRLWFFRAGRGSGKALALDTPIPTPYGWTTMGDLSVGDIVFDERGVPCRVTFCTEVQHDRDCYVVRFDDGSEIVADAEHRWWTWDKRARKAHGRAHHPTAHPKVRTTAEMADSVTVHGGRERNYSIPVAAPLQLPEADLPVDPYCLGYWLGNGSRGCGSITVNDADVEHVIARFTMAGFPANGMWQQGRGCVTMTVGKFGNSPQGFAGRLRSLGVLDDKHVPAIYLRASEDQRRDLLAGLLDSDGHASPGGHVEFSSIDRRLAESVLELAISLGWRATMQAGRATLNGRDCGPKYRVIWTPRRSPFSTPRKSAPFDRPERAQRTRTTHRRIIAIEPVPSVPVRCITVDSPSHLYLAGHSMIPTHNTRAGAETVRAMVDSGRAKRIALVGPTAADVRDVMIEGESGLLSVFPSDERPVWQPSIRRVTFANGAIATSYSADEPERLRGPQHDLAWIDEPASMPRGEEAMSNLLLGLRLGSAPWAMITGTPKPLPWLRALADRADTITTTGTTLDNEAFLARTFIEDVIGRYGDTRLGRQELLAEWLEDVEGALWTQEILDRSRLGTWIPDDPWTALRTQIEGLSVDRRLWRTIVAVDPPGETAECGIVVATAPVQGRAGVDHAVVLEDASIAGRPEEWGARVASVARKWNAERVVVESNQGGDMTRATIQAVDPGIRVEKVTASQSKQARAEPISALYERGLVHHVGFHPMLEAQMTTWIPGEKSPDRMDALVHAIAHLLQARAPAARVVSAVNRRI